jgi:hypothetical protein
MVKVDGTYKVDYFDSFRLQNRYNEPCKIIDNTGDIWTVEVNYPIRKRIIVPKEYITRIA